MLCTMKEPTVRVLRGMNSHVLSLSLSLRHTFIYHTRRHRTLNHTCTYTCARTHTHGKKKPVALSKEGNLLSPRQLSEGARKAALFSPDGRAFVTLIRLEGIHAVALGLPRTQTRGTGIQLRPIKSILPLMRRRVLTGICLTDS